MHKLENGNVLTELEDKTSIKVEKKKLKNEENSFPKNTEGLYINKDLNTMNEEKYKHKNEKLEQNTRHNSEIQKSPKKSESIRCNLCFIDKYFEKKIFAAYDYANRRSTNKKPNEKFSKMKACRRICLLFIPSILFILCSPTIFLADKAVFIAMVFFVIGSVIMLQILLKILKYSCLSRKHPIGKNK
ncbi:Plasmodium exported protein (Pm-fam-a like), unknown function [Plasmodium ovale wallikeri]|uniref:Uncharacterized protein n=1 Tax=Plasmodium ovale wallikeri TaxID=864142 RepID=A0A1A9AHJ5_PLAOA|nr:Plasmodium exported protein (Pm-fam-a like), unknown function [Plasmodium ovale wallikeri]SBT59337.1 Plasmodium exported protein (Pm-fam-a like), unknown function [Plasmodium ovale wallikeri]